MQYKYTKYIIAVAFIALLNITAAKASDADKVAALIAPLVNDSTLVVAHLDFNDVDLHGICSGVVDRLDQSLAYYGFDESSIKGIKKEMQNVIFKGELAIQKYLDILTKKSGIGDAFFIVQLHGNSSDDLKLIPYFAFPTKDRTTDTKKNLTELFDFGIENADILAPFEHAGFQIVVMQPAVDESFELDEIKDIFKNQTPVAKPVIAQAFANTASDTVRAVLFVSAQNYELLVETMQKFASETLVESEIATINWELVKSMQGKTLKAFETIKDKLEWVTYSFNVKTMTVTTLISVKDEETATELRQFSESMIDDVTEVVRNELQKEEEMKIFAPLVSELIRGYYRSFLPEVKGNELVSRVEYQQFGDTFLAFYISAAYFMLPDPEEEEQE